MYLLAPAQLPALQLKTILMKIGQVVRSHWRHKWRHPSSLPNYTDKEEKKIFCQILTQQRLCLCRFIITYKSGFKTIWTKIVSKLRQSCDKQSIFSIFQCKLYDATKAPILVRFRWKYISLVERVSTVIFVPNSCTFIAYWQSTVDKELFPSKTDQNQYFFLSTPVRNTKTLIVRKLSLCQNDRNTD